MRKRTKVISFFIVAAVTSMAFLSCQASDKEKTQASHAGFAIYESTSPIPIYDRGPKWESFYKTGTLTKVLVTDADIEAYDWDNQAIVLTESASKRLQNKVGSFITTLDGTRLYGGKGMNRISQMAVRQPVIYSDSIAGRTVLLIRPEHDFGKRPHLDDKNWDIVAPPAVMDHFAKLGKLKHPWSEEPFKHLLNTVQRIQNLRVKDTGSAIEADYELEGAHTGEYSIHEDIGWTVANEGCQFGPTFEKSVDVNLKKTERKAVFPYESLAKNYQNNNAAALNENKGKPLVWQITVKISPILKASELSSIGLIEQINLKLLHEYGAEVYDMIERQKGEKWSSLDDMKVVRLPMHWDQIKRTLK